MGLLVILNCLRYNIFKLPQLKATKFNSSNQSKNICINMCLLIQRPIILLQNLDDRGVELLLQAILTGKMRRVQKQLGWLKSRNSYLEWFIVISNTGDSRASDYFRAQDPVSCNTLVVGGFMQPVPHQLLRLLIRLYPTASWKSARKTLCCSGTPDACRSGAQLLRNG